MSKKRKNFTFRIIAMSAFIGFLSGCRPGVGSAPYPDLSIDTQTDEETSAYASMQGEVIRDIRFEQATRTMSIETESGKSIEVSADAPKASLLRIKLRTKPFAEPTVDYR